MKRTETTCPFCGAAVVVSAPRVRPFRSRRLSRSRWVLLGTAAGAATLAACDGKLLALDQNTSGEDGGNDAVPLVLETGDAGDADAFDAFDAFDACPVLSDDEFSCDLRRCRGRTEACVWHVEHTDNCVSSSASCVPFTSLADAAALSECRVTCAVLGFSSADDNCYQADEGGITIGRTLGSGCGCYGCPPARLSVGA